MSQHDLPEPRLVAHHVGARGFGVSFNVPATFRADVVHVLYEADSEAVERMKREQGSPMAQALAEKYVLPYCLGRQRGKTFLNVTRNSYASSIFSPNEEFYRYYCEIPIDAAVYDVTYREMLEVVRRVEVEVQSLDELFDEGKIPVAAPPDFLSLDTQGYELEILEGARNTVAQGVLGIVSEVEMIPMYSGQPLLGDVVKFMTKQGFIFAGFTAFFEVSPYRAAIGLRGKAFPGFGDALFLRDLDAMTEQQFGADPLYVMLTKLAFISVSFGYIEYALRALEMADKLKPKVDRKVLDSISGLMYPRFLTKMKAAAAQHEALFPPIHVVPDDARPEGDRRTSWYNKHHQAALKRFQETAASAGGVPTAPPASTPFLAPAPIPAARPPLGVIPPMLRSLLGRIARRFLPARMVGALRRAVTSQTIYAPSPPLVQPQTPTLEQPGASAPHEPHPWSAIKQQTDFERLLEDWGFAGPAYLVYQRRLGAERYVRALDTEMYRDGAQAHLPRG